MSVATDREMTVETILEAMSATAIPEDKSGPWAVQRYAANTWTLDPSGHLVEPGEYTALLHTAHAGAVESVMSDHSNELLRHVEFILQARGTVLVTGLGLGCVLRGLLANRHVHAIDIVERDQRVVDLVWPWVAVDSRVTLHVADAAEFITNERRGDRPATWDYAWHDIWTDSDADEGSLVNAHARLMMSLRGRVGWQGAWHFPRFFRRLIQERHPSLRAWARRRGEAA